MTSDVEHSYGWSSRQESNCNRLKGIQHYRLSVSPTEAEIWFKVGAQEITPGTEVRGRIVGPRSLFVEATEFTSPLRSVRHHEDTKALIARTAFPNPCFWDPQNPFLYRVVVELWQDGQCCDASGFDLGFRVIDMCSGKLFVNQKPYLLKGMPSLPESREEALVRRQSGYNLVMAGKGQYHWWVKANPMGFLLLEKVAFATLTPFHIGLVGHQPCSLGFILEKELLDRPQSESESFLHPWKERGVFIGLELDAPPAQSLPSGLSFLVCPEFALPKLTNISLPKLVLRDSKADRGGDPPSVIPGVFGWIDD
jgi:hypothetical protein